MSIKITKLNDSSGYVVAQNQRWATGVYDTEAVRKAVKVDPTAREKFGKA